MQNQNQKIQNPLKAKSYKLKASEVLHLKAISYKLKASDGFTLIELLTAVAVIGIVSAVVLVNLNAGKKQKDIQRAAQKLMLDIRRAQNMSFAPGSGNDCIYGLKIDATRQKYFLYRRPTCPDPRSSPANNRYNSLDSIITETILIENGVYVSNTSVNQLDISFEAPEPITYLYGYSTSTIPGGAIILSLAPSACPSCVSKKVYINRFGQVEMQ